MGSITQRAVKVIFAIRCSFTWVINGILVLSRLCMCKQIIGFTYIPTLQEIGRVPLHTNLDYKCLEPRMMATSSDTVALALGNMGIAIGGQDVRHLEMSLEEQADFLFRQERKKKASRAKGRSKKDRFVRGMSTRAWRHTEWFIAWSQSDMWKMDLESFYHVNMF